MAASGEPAQVPPMTRPPGHDRQPVRDFDFHPDEEGVRVFVAGPAGVLRLDDDGYVSAGGTS